MNELLMLVGFIVIGIAVAVLFGYFIMKVTAFYKSRFGVSMGPSIISICLSVDLFLVASLLYQNGGDENYTLVFNIVATIMMAYGIYRDIKYYRKMALGAILFQVLVALLQVFIVSAAIITLIVRKVIKRRNDQLNTILNWTKFIWNM